MESILRLRIFRGNSNRIRLQERRQPYPGLRQRNVRSRHFPRPRIRALLASLVGTCSVGLFVSTILPRRTSDDPRGNNPISLGPVFVPKDHVKLGPDSIPSNILVERPLRDALANKQGEGSSPSDATAHKHDGLHQKAESRGSRGAIGAMHPAESHGSAGKRSDFVVDRSSICRNTKQGKTLLADSRGRVCSRTDVDVDEQGCCTERPLREPEIRAPLSVTSENDGNLHRLKPTEIASAFRHHIAEGPHIYADIVHGQPIEPDLSAQYSCWSCDVDSNASSDCCSVYEFCVSCCLHPRHQEAIRDACLSGAKARHPVYVTLAPPLATDNAGEFDTFQFCAFRCRTNSGSVAHENAYRGPLKHCFGKHHTPASPGMNVNSDGSARMEMADSMATPEKNVRWINNRSRKDNLPPGKS